ncbi:MAG: hypothetical protein KA715_11970 [Xanthomonadaceae bacterium]|nr:hypothetical protein [Xanthomonadaceae bacterium]
MKSVIVVMAFLVASGAQAGTFLCKTNDSKSNRNSLKDEVYTVTIEELSQQSNSGNYDTIFETEVTVIKSFKLKEVMPRVLISGRAKAYVEDVNYRIVSRKLGFSFRNFLDEADQATITFFPHGKKLSLTLSCDYVSSTNKK